jgi:uncharacterized protein YjbI with pentapeptide repeats
VLDARRHEQHVAGAEAAPVQAVDEVALAPHNRGGADLTKGKLILAVLSGATQCRTHLSGADLRSADFRSADLSGAALYSADLNGVDLRGAIPG